MTLIAKCFRFLVVTSIVASACAGAKLSNGDSVETIDARSYTGRVRSITSGKVEVFSGGKVSSLPRGDVIRITLASAGELMGRKGQTVVTTTDGGALAADGLKIEGEKLVFDNPLLGKVRLPITSASMLYLPTKTRCPLDIRRKAAEAGRVRVPTRDVFFVTDKNAWMTISGIIRGLDDKNVTFNWKGKERRIPRKDVPAIRLAVVGKNPPAGAGTIVAAGGSSFSFTRISLKDDEFVIDSPLLGRRKTARKNVASVRFNSDRFVELSSLKPAAVREYGFFGKAFAYRVNRSVGGGRLHLNGRDYATGLGVHSFCEMSWNIDGKYDRFVAVVGIDDAARPAGDASITFLGDGKPLGETVRVTGKAPPTTVRLKLSRVRKLTIRVRFGQDKLGIGDHVDIAEARLIK